MSDPANVIAITQARRGSSRLPDKILRTVLGKPLLRYHLERLGRAKCLTGHYVATTTAAEDHIIEDLCQEWQVPCYRGPVEDVLARFAQVVEAVKPDIIIRVTSDCPLIDPTVIDALYEAFVARRVDYMSLDTAAYPHGLDCEIMTRAAFDAAAQEADNPFEREHVTPFIYHRPERFQIAQLSQDEDHRGHRWTVDYPEDFEFVRSVLERIYPVQPDFGWRDVLRLVTDEPDLLALNADAEARWQMRLTEARKVAGITA